MCFQCQGGNGVVQRIRRLIYDVKVTLTVSPVISRPVFCFLFVFVTSDLCVLYLSSRSSARLHCSAAS